MPCLARVLQKMPRKILSPKGLEVEIFDFKELIGRPSRLYSTAFASTMMGRFSKRHKVRCHIEAGYSCGKPDSSTRCWYRFQFWRVAAQAKRITKGKEGYASAERHASQSLALPELR
jgi:hypothetical protein